MAGTLFSLAMSCQVDSEGKPLINAPLYIFAANTSTPVDAYQDYGLTITHQRPVRTDSNGRLPAFWLPDGQYRARLTNAAASVIYFDIPSIQAVGPSSGVGGGGGSVDPSAIFATGDELWGKRSGPRSGWVRQNGRTIGSGSSGATERANADTQPLYEYLYNFNDDVMYPVTGGRGANAAVDFAANKPIQLPDMRGYGPLGLGDMGNVDAGRIVDGTPTVAGSSGGAEKVTIAQANLPNVTLNGSTSTDGNHEHGYTGYGSDLTGSSSPAYQRRNNPQSSNTNPAGDHSHTVTVSLGGSGTQLNTMSPYRLGTWWIKL